VAAGPEPEIKIAITDLKRRKILKDDL